MIFSQPFRSNEQKQEVIPQEAGRNAYACFYRELDECIGKRVSWHWHPAIEIDYVVEGEIKYQTTEKNIIAHTGEMIFINSNVMHMVYSQNNRQGCKLYAHLFDVSFLGGSYNSYLAERYILPVIKNRGLDIVVLKKKEVSYDILVGYFMKAVKLCREEQFGYEFEVRAELSQLWLTLLGIFMKMPETISEEKNADIERLKMMVSYIHLHYMEALTLKDIAAIVNISSRECTRCFQRNIHISPIKYLNEYRIQRAAQMLSQTSDSVLTVSENCGFSSGSYFGKAFRGIMGCTPKEFRKNQKKNSINSNTINEKNLDEGK